MLSPFLDSAQGSSPLSRLAMHSATAAPPGTVHLGVSGPGVDEAQALRLVGDRAAVRRAAVGAALDLLVLVLRAAAPAPEQRPVGTG